jgi:hypothetical protein
LLSRIDVGSLAHATVGRGVVRSICAPSDDGASQTWLAAIGRCEGTHIFERLPARAWRSVPCRVDDPLSRSVRTAFDPARILNRGILGEVA